MGESEPPGGCCGTQNGGGDCFTARMQRAATHFSSTASITTTKDMYAPTSQVGVNVYMGGRMCAISSGIMAWFKIQ